MLLRKLGLTNVGLFQGKHEFDLIPRKTKTTSRPITLIGGMNGAGKTTILDSLRLCLYGKDMLGSRIAQSIYDNYLEDLIHRSKDPQLISSEASIQIEFEHSYLGKTDIYLVDRSWRKNGSGVVESLTIKKNGKPLSDLVSDQWQAFIKELIPPGLSGLFFFDGEKVQNLADEVQGSVELADSIRSLLGLDLAKRLSQDLKVYIKRHASTKSDAKLDLQLQKIENEQDNLEKSLSFIEQDLAEIETKKQHVEGQLERVNQKLKSEGGEFASSRSNLEVEERHLAEKQEKLENHIQTLCAESLPFLLAPSLCKNLLGQLDKEAELIQKQDAANELKKLSRKVNSELSPKFKNSGIDTKTSKQVVSLLRSWLKEKASINGDVEKYILHGLSTNEKRDIEIILKDTVLKVSNEIKEVSKSLQNTCDRRLTVQAALAVAPSEDALRPLFEEMSSLREKLGGYSQKIKTLDEEIRSLRNKIAELTRQSDKLQEKKASKNKTLTKAKLAIKVSHAMNDYIKKITERKIQQLNDVVLEKYLHLSTKTDVVKSVSINPKTFKVSLLNSQGNKLEMKELSAGEKQILAVSILWALASTSGRLLPVVIDTPLGRLDSSHRDNLITNYFPLASHQVIILSTDTEVDKSLYEKLSPHIANIYHIDYDQSAERTTSSRGYFWKTGAK